jgi:hypothetical protein
VQAGNLDHLWTVIVKNPGPGESGRKTFKIETRCIHVGKIKMEVESFHTYLIRGEDITEAKITRTVLT